MKRIIASLLLLLLCTAALSSLAEEEAIVPLPTHGEVMYLPIGMWILNGDGSWSFKTQTDTPLSDPQVAWAQELGILTRDKMLPADSIISSDLLLQLYPGMEDHFSPPSQAPDLELFSLTGEWFYGDDDVLYYRHGDGYATMTVDEVFAQLNGTQVPTAGTEKIIYLTIDDSPSIYTMDLLATLERLDVKATFFVVGAYVRQRPIFLRAIYEQGHVIANHSYTHDATTLSSSFRSCLADFQRCEAAVAEALGFELAMPILRVPYGSSTIPVSFRTQLQENGYMWIDWNALNGDTEPTITSDSAALRRAISTAGRYDGSIVMLVHDGKKRTIRTLEEMVEHFRNEGYEFRVLDTNLEKIPGVRMGLPL